MWKRSPLCVLYSPLDLFVPPPPSLLLLGNCYQEMEFLDVTSIRDTRFGKFAKMPKVNEPGSSHQLHRARNEPLLGVGNLSVGLDEWVPGC